MPEIGGCGYLFLDYFFSPLDFNYSIFNYPTGVPVQASRCGEQPQVCWLPGHQLSTQTGLQAQHTVPPRLLPLRELPWRPGSSSHYVLLPMWQVTMLTGDNPLTACHVAKELKISQNKQLVLTQEDPTSDRWVWQKVGGDSAYPLTDWDELRKQYDLCITGDVSISTLLTSKQRM